LIEAYYGAGCYALAGGGDCDLASQWRKERVGRFWIGFLEAAIAHRHLLGTLEQSVLMFGERPYTLELMVGQQRILSIL
jgi:hypothetical protein